MNQLLQVTVAAIPVLDSSLSLSAAAAAEMFRSAVGFQGFTGDIMGRILSSVALAVILTLVVGCGPTKAPGVPAATGADDSPKKADPPPTAPAQEAKKEAKPVWDRAKIAKLTLLVTKENEAKTIVEFPQRDFRKAAEQTLDAVLDATRQDNRLLARQLEADVNDKNGGLELIIHLFAKQEANWPKDNSGLKMEVWGIRTKGAIGQGPSVWYDLKLDCRPQDDGSFKGQATGRIRIGPNSSDWVILQGADLLLEPVLPSEGKK